MTVRFYLYIYISATNLMFNSYSSCEYIEDSTQNSCSTVIISATVHFSVTWGNSTCSECNQVTVNYAFRFISYPYKLGHVLPTNVSSDINCNFTKNPAFMKTESEVEMNNLNTIVRRLLLLLYCMQIGCHCLLVCIIVKLFFFSITLV